MSCDHILGSCLEFIEVTHFNFKLTATGSSQVNLLQSAGAIHSTKMSGNFGLKLNGSVRSNRESFEKTGPPFEVDHFSRLDRSNRNGPFHLTISTHSQFQDLTVRYLPCTKWRKILITALLRIVNSRSISVTRTSMCSYHRSVAAFASKVYVLAADGS